MSYSIVVSYSMLAEAAPHVVSYSDSGTASTGVRAIIALAGPIFTIIAGGIYAARDNRNRNRR